MIVLTVHWLGYGLYSLGFGGVCKAYVFLRLFKYAISTTHTASCGMRFDDSACYLVLRYQVFVCCFMQIIQDDFVRLRQETETKTSPSDLHLLLVLARWCIYTNTFICFVIGQYIWNLCFQFSWFISAAKLHSQSSGSKGTTQKTTCVPENLSLEFCEMAFIYSERIKLFSFNLVLVMESWKRWVLLHVFLAYSM